MAAGLVAAIALPVLAMLAGVGSMQSNARDRETASRIARETAAALVPASPRDGYELSFPGGGWIAVPTERETFLFAAFDADGNYLERISEERFRAGDDLGGRAFHLVRLRLSGIDPRSLLDLEISVEQPTAAPEAVRSREVFPSRLARP